MIRSVSTVHKTSDSIPWRIPYQSEADTCLIMLSTSFWADMTGGEMTSSNWSHHTEARVWGGDTTNSNWSDHTEARVWGGGDTTNSNWSDHTETRAGRRHLPTSAVSPHSRLCHVHISTAVCGLSIRVPVLRASLRWASPVSRTRGASGRAAAPVGDPAAQRPVSSLRSLNTVATVAVRSLKLRQSPTINCLSRMNYRSDPCCRIRDAGFVTQDSGTRTRADLNASA